MLSLWASVLGDELQPALLPAWSETGRPGAQLFVLEHSGGLPHLPIRKENEKAGSSVLAGCDGNNGGCVPGKVLLTDVTSCNNQATHTEPVLVLSCHSVLHLSLVNQLYWAAQ